MYYERKHYDNVYTCTKSFNEEVPKQICAEGYQQPFEDLNRTFSLLVHLYSTQIKEDRGTIHQQRYDQIIHWTGAFSSITPEIIEVCNLTRGRFVKFICLSRKQMAPGRAERLRDTLLWSHQHHGAVDDENSTNSDSPNLESELSPSWT